MLNKSCSICYKLLLQFFFFFGEIPEMKELGSENVFFHYQSINKPRSPLFLRFHCNKKKFNSNLEQMEQLLFKKFYPQMIFIFHLYCIKYRVFRKKKTGKSTKMPNPMQFSHWNHRSRYPYSVLKLFWHLGMLFWVLAKMWEVA